MRILSVDVEQYGIFANQHFDFGSGRFQLICGPNEAGKSTLLQLIRESLFGFPHQSPYRFHEVGEMAATMRMVLENGREVQFRRRKGRKDTVVGQFSDGASLNEEGLETLLGASSSLFQSVFAFSLAELASGQESLEQSQLTEALFGGAIGGLAKFKLLNKRIEDDAADLFTPRSSKRAINLLLQRIDDLQQQLDDAAARPVDFQQLVSQHREHELQISKLTKQLEQLRDARQEAARMCDAWAPFLKLQQLKRQQTGGGKLKLTAEQWEQAESLRSKRKQLADRIQQQQDVIARRKTQQARLTSAASDDILAQQSQLQAMMQETSRMQDFVEQLPQRQRELEEATEQIRARLRNLDLHWDPSRLDQIPDDRQLQKRLQAAARDLNEKRRQLEEVRRLERQFRLQLKDVENELASGNQSLGSQGSEGENPETTGEWDDWDSDWNGDFDGDFEGDLNSRSDESLTEPPRTGDRSEAANDKSTARGGAKPKGASRVNLSHLEEMSPRPFDALDSMDPLAIEPAATHEEVVDTWEPLEDLDLDDADAFAAPEQGPMLTHEQKSVLDELVENESTDLAARHEMASIDSLRKTKRDRIAALEIQMREWGPDWNWETTTPDEAIVDEARQRWHELQQRLRSANQHYEEIHETLASLEREAAKQFEHAPPNDEELRQLRVNRDEAWELIRRHFVERNPQDEAAESRFECDAKQLARQFPQMLRSADEAADIRQDQASVVARMNASRNAIEARRKDLATATLRQQQAKDAVNACEQAWAEQWPGGPPLGDPKTSAWLKAQRERRDLDAESRILDKRWAEFADTTDKYERSLRAALSPAAQGGSPPPDLETLRVELRERLRRHHRWEARREHLEIRQHELSAQLEEAIRDEARLANSERHAELAWDDLRQRMRLPEQWEAETISSQLSELTAAKAAWERVGELEKAVATMQAEIAGFRSRVERIAGESNQDRSTLDTLHQLSLRLQSAQQSRQQLSASQAEDQRLHDELVQLQTEAKRATEQWLALREQSGAESDDALIAGLEGASIHQQLSAAEREVFAALGCDDPARRVTLISELERSSEIDLSRRLKEANDRVAQVAEQLNQTHKDEGASRNRLQQVDGSDAAAAVDMQRQSALAELSEVVDRWAPLKLAAKLMEQALERFERNHQPALLEKVAQLFKKMTGGAYVEVRRQLDKNGTLLAIGPQGQAKTPNQLSTGAREQLYLAIRLAYVHQYCQQAEPLPLVLDDVLVNFDETRAKRTIDVLLELADEMQILMLTCHRNTARLVHHQCPGMQPILLSNDPKETLEQWILPPASRTRRRRPGAAPESPQQGILFPKG